MIMLYYVISEYQQFYAGVRLMDTIFFSFWLALLMPTFLCNIWIYETIQQPPPPGGAVVQWFGVSGVIEKGSSVPSTFSITFAHASVLGSALFTMSSSAFSLTISDLTLLSWDSDIVLRWQRRAARKE